MPDCFICGKEIWYPLYRELKPGLEGVGEINSVRKVTYMYLTGVRIIYEFDINWMVYRPGKSFIIT